MRGSWISSPPQCALLCLPAGAIDERCIIGVKCEVGGLLPAHGVAQVLSIGQGIQTPTGRNTKDEDACSCFFTAQSGRYSIPHVA